jgi:hypothetical protein
MPPRIASGPYALMCAGCWLLDLGQLVEALLRDLLLLAAIGADEIPTAEPHLDQLQSVSGAIG